MKKIKNILYIGGFELPDKNAAAHRVINNAKLLRSLGCSVSFLGMSKDHVTEGLSPEFNYSGFKSRAIKYPGTTKEWIGYVTSISHVKTMMDQNVYDTVITYNFPAVCSMKLLKLCRKRNITAVSDCTEWYDHKISSATGLIKFLDSEFRMKYFNFKYDGLICISSFLYDLYKKHPVKVLLPPLTDTEVFGAVTPDSARDSHKLSLIYAGSPGNKDMISCVIEALSEVKNINDLLTFDIFGAEASKPHPDFVKFHGRVPHSEIVKRLERADFMIFIRENTRLNNAGFPTKFSEAVSCGTPVITNRTSDLAGYLEEGRNGFFIDTSDKNELSGQLESIISCGKEKILEMKQYCKSSKIFDYRQYSSKMTEFLTMLEKTR